MALSDDSPLHTSTRTATGTWSELDTGWPARSAMGTPEQPSEMRDAPQDDLPDDLPLEGSIKHYEIIRPLGRGGMGVVLLARDTKLGRLVAIKLLRDRTSAAARLLVEAQATAAVRDEHIVVIHEVDEIAGHPYMVLEYLEGKTLRQLVRERAARGRTGMPLGPALELMIPVVRALAAAHQSGLVHRDLKPENIMVMATGQVKVLDFGIAVAADATAAAASDRLAGTRPYMAPEQWRGHEVDGRCDVWAVGVILFELLAGAHPLAPFTPERMASVADAGQRMPGLGDGRPELARVAGVVDRCLEKAAGARWQSAEALLAALESVRVGAPVVAGPDVRPFAGLTAMQESDAGRFFGRESDVLALMGRVPHQRIVTVAGPSGAGKSSLVRAGLIASLERSGDAWHALVTRPGRAPLGALAEALCARGMSPDVTGRLARRLREQPGLFGTLLRARLRESGPAPGPAHRALVFVDQFEELYTLGADADERNAFIACLEGAADDLSSPVRVLLSVRSDFLHRMAENLHFMAEITAGLFFVPPMGRAGLTQALMRPLEAAGYRFEDPALGARMLDELALARSPLPLLQFTASLLWDARDREAKLITRASYERIGGVAGALASHADAILAALAPGQKELCRALFVRLVTPERTRAVVLVSELFDLAADREAVDAVVQHMVAARLLVLETGAGPDDATVELSHEALIERWPRLNRWLDECAEDAEFLARVRAAANQWHAAGETDGLLWRDQAAGEARAWYQRRGDRADALLGGRDMRFLRAVMALRERGKRRRRRALAAAFTALAMIAVLVSWLALRAAREARRADSEAAMVRATNQELSLQALRGRNAERMLAAHKHSGDPTLSLALLREVEAADIPAEWSVMVSAALASGVARVQRSFDEPAYSVAFSPDGARIAVGLQQGTAAHIVDARDLSDRVVLRGHDDHHVSSVVFSPDGTRLATASGDGTARVWNADGTGEALVLSGHQGAVKTAAFSPDGRLLVTASHDQSARVWRLADASQRRLIAHPARVEAAAFSPDGARIATACQDGLARVWQVDDEATPPLILRGHEGAVLAVLFSPDGTRIATIGVDRTVRLWDAAGGQETYAFRDHTDKVMGMAFSPDSARVASVSKDRTARVWNIDGSGLPLVLRGHGHWLYDADVSPDGRYLVTSSLDRSIRVWDMERIEAPRALTGHRDVVSSVSFDPTGRRLVTASADRTARVWDADHSGEPVILGGDGDQLLNARFSPDGTRIATLSADVRVFSADGRGQPLVLTGGQRPLTDVVWSPAGDLIAATDDRDVRLWNAADGQEVALIQLPYGAAPSIRYGRVVFDATGRRLAAANISRRELWLAERSSGWVPVLLGEHEGNIQGLAFSPDGTRVASVSEDGTARLWDTAAAAPPVILRGHAGAIHDLSFSPDGTRLATASEDATARVWRTDGSGAPVVLRGHQASVLEVGFSPDGRYVATTSKDATARIWNADGAGQPVVMVGGSAPLTTLTWSPDGTRIAGRADEPVVRVWRVIEPFSGPGDARLWSATSYCMPAHRRVELLGVTGEQARADQEMCQRRVVRAP